MIDIEHLTFTYSAMEEAALKDISLHIPAGQCVLLCGESGCGKTTLTQLINGLIPHYYEIWNSRTFLKRLEVFFKIPKASFFVLIPQVRLRSDAKIWNCRSH